MAAGGADGAGQRAERGGLAGTVGAEDGDNLALFHLEADVVEHRCALIAGLQVFCLENYHVVPPR